MLIEDQHPNNKSIMVAILGAPNVGKSSLANCFLGTDLAVVTNKPQTTRNQFQCVLLVDRTEIILVDTPGLHRSNQEINKRMNEQARDGAGFASLNLLLIDLSAEVMKQFVDFKEAFRETLGPTWVVFTKSDLIPDAQKLPFEEVIAKARELIPEIEKYFFVSSKNGDNIHALTGAICDVAPSAPHRYTEGEISNKSERFFVTEYIREQAFLLLKEELPYELAVIIDEYKDLREDEESRDSKIISHISASIIVNRPSQRAIVVGSGGQMIKEIGTRSRMKIEALLGGQVHLNLHVKVMPRWFKNNFVLEEIGLPRAKDSTRVWRKK